MLFLENLRGDKCYSKLSEGYIPLMHNRTIFILFKRLWHLIIKNSFMTNQTLLNFILNIHVHIFLRKFFFFEMRVGIEPKPGKKSSKYH